MDNKELIEKMRKIADRHPYKVSGNRESYSQYNEGWEDCADEMIHAATQHFTPAPEWVSVEDRLPEKTGKYLTINSIWNMVAADFDGKLFKWILEIKGVTHWMPLPHPPKDSNNG